MHNSFTRGLVIGSVIGASVGKMMDTNMMNGRSRKRMMKSGKTMMRKTGNIIGDLVDIFR